MSVKIIKEGKKVNKTYIAECKHCGCQFEYGDEDIVFYGNTYAKLVLCPSCHTFIAHIESEQNVYVPEPLVIPTAISTSCEECAWYKQMSSSQQVYVGDTPCQWCKHNQITCVSK